MPRTYVAVFLLALLSAAPAAGQLPRRQQRMVSLQQQNALLQQQNAVQTAVQQATAVLKPQPCSKPRPCRKPRRAASRQSRLPTGHGTVPHQLAAATDGLADRHPRDDGLAASQLPTEQRA